MTQILEPLLVVGLGESLFDCFPNRSVLGGAPLNVAFHADRLLRSAGGAGVVATRVGGDPLGDRLLAELDQRGLRRDYVQRDPRRPTGRVDITTDASGDASYRFPSSSAWDALELTQDWLALAAGCSAVAFGTLGQRHASSRATIRAFLSEARAALRLFDVNLREAFYSAEVLHESLTLATAAKMNEAELRTVGELLGQAERNRWDELECAHSLAERFDLDWLAVTRGARGATLYAGGERHESGAAGSADAADSDTVGAGDACCAGLICGALLGWPGERTVEWANQLGAFVATQPGATPELPAHLVEAVSAT